MERSGSDERTNRSREKIGRKFVREGGQQKQ